MSDSISRQDAIRLAEQGQIQGFEWQFKKLCELPSAERKKGKWLLLTDERFDIDYYKCSECGYEPYRKMDISNFCPNCGADMRGEQDD